MEARIEINDTIISCLIDFQMHKQLMFGNKIMVWKEFTQQMLMHTFFCDFIQLVLKDA